VRTLRGRMLVGFLPALLAVVVFAGPATAANAGNAAVRVCKQIDSAGLRNLGQCVSSAQRGGRPPAPGPHLEISTGTYDCIGHPLDTCWGTLTGSGLNPNSQWFVFVGEAVISFGQTDANGSISATPLNVQCFGTPDEGLIGAQAEGPAGKVFAAAAPNC
jgi:hypothetical protein